MNSLCGAVLVGRTGLSAALDPSLWYTGWRLCPFGEHSVENYRSWVWNMAADGWSDLLLAIRPTSDSWRGQTLCYASLCPQRFSWGPSDYMVLLLRTELRLGLKSHPLSAIQVWAAIAVVLHEIWWLDMVHNVIWIKYSVKGSRVRPYVYVCSMFDTALKLYIICLILKIVIKSCCKCDCYITLQLHLYTYKYKYIFHYSITWYKSQDLILFF